MFFSGFGLVSKELFHEIIPLRPIQNQKRTHIDANKRINFVDAILKKVNSKKEINIKFKNGANHKLIY